MIRTIRLIIAVVIGLGLTSSRAAAQVVDSVGAGFTKVMVITENAETAHIDAVVQMVIGGLDLNKNGRQEFLYVTDNTFTGARQATPLGYSLFLYEYNPATANYGLLWKYTVRDTVGGSFPVFTIADLDGDGNKEIVLPVQYGANLPLPGANPDRLLVFEFGAGPLPTEPTATWNFDAPPGSNTRPSAIIAGDVDGDGREELGIAFRAFSGATKGIIVTSVDGAFAGPLTTWRKEVYDTTTTTGTIFGTARITDMDNDGRKEFCFVTNGNGRAVFYEATAANTYSRFEWNLIAGTGLTAGPILSLAEVDINRDGKNELLFGRTSPAVLHMIGDITDLAVFDSTKVRRVGYYPNHPLRISIDENRGVAAGDFDGNLRTDIFFASPGRIWRLEYKGTGSIYDSTSYTATIAYQDTTSGTRFRWVTFTGDTWARSQGITSRDMDGDNEPELLIANQRGGSPVQGASKIVILERSAVTSVEIAQDGGIVRTFTLEQNYPNPFNPSTTIKYSVSGVAQVRLEIFDIVGQKVATLVDGQVAAGNHSVVFDASNLPTGTYIYLLSVGEHRLSKKMTLMK